MVVKVEIIATWDRWDIGAHETMSVIVEVGTTGTRKTDR